jgi:hypothetical protein
VKGRLNKPSPAWHIHPCKIVDYTSVVAASTAVGNMKVWYLDMSKVVAILYLSNYSLGAP